MRQSIDDASTPPPRPHSRIQLSALIKFRSVTVR